MYYALNLFIEHSEEHWWEHNIFCSFTTPQAFWQNSVLGALSTLVTSVLLYLLTRATLMSPGKDETRVCGYIRSEFIHWALWRTLMRTKIFFVRSPQVFWQSSAPDALSTLVTSVVLYSLTRATLMSPGKDKTRVCGYTLWIYSWSTLENTDESRIFFVGSPHHKHIGKAQLLVL